MQHDGRAYCIENINDMKMCIGAHILASNIFRNNCPIQCTSRVIACAQQCTNGFQMNWSLFLLNQLIKDTVIVHVKEQPYTYSSLLILNTLVVWMEPEDYQRMTVEAVKV